MTVAMQSLEEPSALIHPDALLLSYENGSSYKRHGPTQISIVVTEHPSSSFYKDEGGKSNHMTAAAAIKIVNGKSSGRRQSLPYGTLTLKPKLVYESGTDVEDADEIFKILSTEPECLDYTGQPIVVKFRIEKVSRRKDGKRFKICFDVDLDKSSQYEKCNIHPVMTEPVVVLSKRKNSVNSTGSQPKGVSKKRLKTGKNDEKNAAKDSKGLAQLQSSVRVLEKKLFELTERVSVLETENKMLQSKLNDDFALETLSEYQAVASLAEPDEDLKNRSTPNRRNKMDDSTWEDNLCMLKFDKFEEGDSSTLKPIPTRRNKSSDMNFNFGLPSASFGPRNYFGET